MLSKKTTAKEVANDKAERIMLGVAVWCSFYRANPQRFCKDILNIELKMFQQVLIYLMAISQHFVFIAARGLRKTFLCAIFCCWKCYIFPGTKICITSKTRAQGSLVLEKIQKELIPNSDLLRAEIKEITINQSKAEIVFRNHSYIEVVTASDTARGHRANLLVCDEFRMIDKNTIDLVLKKFLTSPRQPGYIIKSQYKHLAERNQEMYLSSA